MTTQTLVPTNGNYSLSDISTMSAIFTKSGFFTGLKSEAQACVKIQAGKELGLPPVYSMQHIIVIDDKITCDSHTLARLIKQSGKYTYRVIKNDESITTIKFYEREANQWVEIGENSFSIEEAKRAGLTRKSVWTMYPKAMLFARALSQGARQHCPDAIGGVYLTEEIELDSPPLPVPVVTCTESPAVTYIESPQDNSPEAEWSEIAGETTPTPPTTAETDNTDFIDYVTTFAKDRKWQVPTLVNFFNSHQKEIGNSLRMTTWVGMKVSDVCRHYKGDEIKNICDLIQKTNEAAGK
ncbi:MAG: hypothetical protein FWH42_01305 [Dehalococcoidia bacterium]|nr:hypothetical protein [Dehalococcoidia bacterium]